MAIPTPGHTQVMGILNITTDSFSDGGLYRDPAAQLAHAHAMLDAGATIIDIGAESTGPGATRVDEADEKARILDAVTQLAPLGAYISVDTMRASVAAAALTAGAHMINDVSAGLADPDMLPVVADAGADLCLMHWETDCFGDAARQETSGDAAGLPQRVHDFLTARTQAAVNAGIPAANIAIDPGLGFGKDADDNWMLLNNWDTWASVGFPILIGASRKRFLTTLLPEPDGTPSLPTDVDDATAAISALAAAKGAWAVRVHAVRPSIAATRVAQAWAAGTGPAIPAGWRARRG